MKRFLYIISALLVSVVAMGQTTQGLTGKYINFVGGLQASEAFKLPVYSTNPSQNGLGNQGRIWFDPVLNKFRGHDGTTVSSLCRENSVTLQMALNNGSVATINQATLIEYDDGTDMANVYVGDGTIDLNANDGQFHMNGTGADISVPLSLLATPTEPNHAARLQDIESVTNNFVPLEGTLTGSPFNGVLEVADGSAVFVDDGQFNVGGSITGISFSSGGTIVYDYGGGVGLAGSSDFSDNILSTNRSAYPQVGWVVDYVTANAGGNQNLQDVLTTGNTATTDIVFADYMGPKGLNGSTAGYVKFIDGNVLIGSNAVKTTKFKDHGIEIDSSVTDGIKGLGDFSSSYTDYSFVQKKWVTDYVAANAGGGGISVVNGTTGEITSTNVSGTVTLGISSTYTAARNSYADSAAASAASGKQNTLVSGTNIKTVGGVSLLGSGNVTEVQNSLAASTTLAPSVTAVNNALLYFPRIIFASTTAYPGTGSTSAILLKAVPVAANDLSNGTLQVDLKARFTGTAGTKQILLYYNTSASLTGATLLATGVSHASNVPMTELRRKFSLNGTSLRGLSPTFPTFDIATSTSTDLNVTYNPANQYYIIAACVNGSSADTSTLDMFNITFTKATE